MHIHVCGAAGFGMSALAQFYAGAGMDAVVTGSDRHFDRGGAADFRDRLARAGVRIVPQDGRAIRPETAFVAVSTAVEAGNPDLDAAARLSVPVRHRSECLAEIAAARRTAVVAGTSGKSTTTAILYEILRANGPASILTGGPLISLRERGLVGNAAVEPAGILAVEGDESDGTLVRYRPEVGVLLNLSRDHQELPELARIFAEFLAGAGVAVVDSDEENLAPLVPPGARTWGFSRGERRAELREVGPRSSSFAIDGVEIHVPLPGRYNAKNALLAVAAADALGIPPARAAVAVAAFSGVQRRFEIVGAARGTTVVDDFAHNPDKLRAALSAARAFAAAGGGRVLAIWQPHGFGPARFFFGELIDALAKALGPEDVLWLPPIYDAGGTADRTIGSADLAAPLAAAGRDARHAPYRAALIREVAAAARPGDLVISMGARDPELPAFARTLLAALSGREGGLGVAGLPPIR